MTGDQIIGPPGPQAFILWRGFCYLRIHSLGPRISSPFGELFQLVSSWPTKQHLIPDTRRGNKITFKKMFWCQCFIILKDGKKLSAHRTLQIPSKQQGAQTLRRKKKTNQTFASGRNEQERILLFPCVILNILF